MRARAVAWRALTVLVGLVLMGHSPYRQWAIYRESHLVVVADGAAPGAFAVSEAVAGALRDHLARSRAVAASARGTREAVALLRNRQLRLAILLGEDVAAAARAEGPFAGQPPLELRALARLGPYLLVTLDDFPAGKAAEIARIVANHPPAAELPAAEGTVAVPLHQALRPAAAQGGDCQRAEGAGC